MCIRDRNLLFTTGVFIAPARDLVTVAKSVGTAAVLSSNRLRLGVGVGWCEEEFVAIGQEFSNRGKRLDEMIVALRALWHEGWVEHHGTYYDIPACKDVYKRQHFSTAARSSRLADRFARGAAFADIDCHANVVAPSDWTDSASSDPGVTTRATWFPRSNSPCARIRRCSCAPPTSPLVIANMILIPSSTLERCRC